MGKETKPSNFPQSMEEKANMDGFEGVEKRLELAFMPMTNATKQDGLRLLTHSQISNFLKLAGCTIVSELHNSYLDSYILSESSLFVYPHRIILKTCGRTQVLQCISLLLSYASGLALEPCFCKYTHGTFLFPLKQPFPYTCFEEEVKYLDSFFGYMGSRAYTLGSRRSDNEDCPAWHLYSAASESYGTFITSHEPLYTLEMGMTHLSQECTRHFLNESGLKTGRAMTESSSIDKIFPSASISDFAFMPCGYSMNGIEGQALSTIHVTPEETQSYGSFEAVGYDSHSLRLSLQELMDRLMSMFRPLRVAMSLHVSRLHCSDLEGGPDSWASSSAVPLGYVCDFTERQVLLPQGSIVTFHTFHRGQEEGILGVVPRPLLPSWSKSSAKRHWPFCGASDDVDECSQESELLHVS